MKCIKNKKKSNSKAKSRKNTIKRQIKIHKKDTNRLWKFWLFRCNKCWRGCSSRGFKACRPLMQGALGSSRRR